MRNALLLLLLTITAVLPLRSFAATLEGRFALTLELQKSVYGLEDGERLEFALDRVKQQGDWLGFSSEAYPDLRVLFQLEDKQGYQVLRLKKVVAFPGVHATRLKLKANADLRLFPLNAEVLRDRGESVVFAGLLKRSPETQLGAVAFWPAGDAEQDDEILYRLWANEGLPHPAIEGEWTVDRAKQWVVDYIETFKNYSEMYITGETLQELKQCVDHAERLKMKCVYMHLMTWSGRYWPVNQSLYDLNAKLFPNGHADFKELVDYAASKGIRVGLRTLSNGISLQNPDYVTATPDKRLSHFWRGTLVKAIDANSKELIIRSDQTLPTSFNTKMERGFYDFVHIDDEIFRFKSAKENADGSLTLTVATKGSATLRGHGLTRAVAHPEGARVKILMGAVSDKVTPDHDSSLLDVIAAEYAEFNNKMQLITCSFDGLMIYHINTEYGKTKFPGAVYSKLDHPTFCTTSGGQPQWGWFEKDFNSVRSALGLNKTSSIPKRMTLMLGLHQDTWPAPSPYGYTYAIVPNAVAGFMWCSVQNQNGLHDFNLNTFQNFGMFDQPAESIQRWRQYGPGLPESVKERIFGAYDRAPRYPLQVEHFRFEANGDDLDVVPFRPMRRAGIDRGWGYIQEHGPVYTYQYLRPNSEGLVQAENPYDAQVPEFIIRVMQDFDREMLTGSVEEAGSVNYRIMIPSASAEGGKKKKTTVNPGKMELSMESRGARITYENKSGKTVDLVRGDERAGGLISYPVSSSIKNAKGLGVVITGDGSGALFVVRILGSRDYLIPIDFTGKRYIEIADPQVSWSDARWPITSAWKRWAGPTVRGIATGFGMVPPKTKASVVVEEIRFLPEKPSALINPVVECGSGTISIQGTIPSDHYLWYRGGDSVEVFDLNWNKLQELPVVENNAQVPAGRSDIRINNQNSAGDPWLECQFFVRDVPIHVIQR
jgi:hypothetical protein